MLHASRVQWSGELDDRARDAMLGGARALLASCDRTGSSEMQSIEALACALAAASQVAHHSLDDDGRFAGVISLSDIAERVGDGAARTLRAVSRREARGDPRL
jgi:hypothetical protein